MKHAQRIIQFGHNLREIRKRKGWTQSKLSDEAEIDIRTVQRIENAELNTTVDVIISLCTALDIGVEELFKGIISDE